MEGREEGITRAFAVSCYLDKNKLGPVFFNISHQDSHALSSWDSPLKILDSPLLRHLRILPLPVMNHHKSKVMWKKRGRMERRARVVSPVQTHFSERSILGKDAQKYKRWRRIPWNQCIPLTPGGRHCWRHPWPRPYSVKSRSSPPLGLSGTEFYSWLFTPAASMITLQVGKVPTSLRCIFLSLPSRDSGTRRAWPDEVRTEATVQTPHYAPARTLARTTAELGNLSSLSSFSSPWKPGIWDNVSSSFFFPPSLCLLPLSAETKLEIFYSNLPVNNSLVHLKLFFLHSTRRSSIQTIWN